MFKTRITELYGIEHPILQGGLQWLGNAEFTAAVAEAGAMPFMTAMSHDSPEKFRAEIRKCKDLTDKAFGVNIALAPSMRPPDYPGMMAVCAEEGIRFVETAGQNPEPLMPTLKEAGIKVLHKCTSVRHALKAQGIGVDAVTIEGFECAGHPGEDDVTTLILIPLAAAALDVPLVASGGFGDGRGLAAALSLGAEGIAMGTRFVATQECPAHDDVKKALVDADERSTSVVLRSLRNSFRSLHNRVVDDILEIEARGNISFEDVGPLASGLRTRDNVWGEGDVDGGLISTGQVVGLIRDIPTVRELVNGIVAEAEEVIRDRLPGLLV